MRTPKISRETVYPTAFNCFSNDKAQPLEKSQVLSKIQSA